MDVAPGAPAPDEVVAPDDDLRERIARVGQDTDPELVRQPEPPADDLRERTLAQVATGSAAWSAVRRHLTQFEPITSAADMDALASEIADAVLAVLPTPPPTPPWPGAVLSGLVDEDGVPTWLAQAGQVRGEQVRGWRDMAWYRPHGHSSDTWVEVRDPRAVPAAPVTVTIPAETAHALLRYIEDGDYDTDYVIDRLADLLIAAMDGDQ